MPLPSSNVPRKLKHTRQITLEGYAREDGLWDIEAHITDHKTRPVLMDRGTPRPVGEALHDMTLRLTIDTQMNVVDVVAVTDAAPYPGLCESIAPAYRKLIGLNLFKKFRQTVRERVGGVGGCTHITELSNVLPTAALQSFVGEVAPYGRQPESGTVEAAGQEQAQPFHLDKCHALRTDGEAVRLYYPKWYRAPT